MNLMAYAGWPGTAKTMIGNCTCGCTTLQSECSNLGIQESPSNRDTNSAK